MGRRPLWVQLLIEANVFRLARAAWLMRQATRRVAALGDASHVAVFTAITAAIDEEKQRWIAYADGDDKPPEPPDPPYTGR
jgi:hypothetical protein